MHNVDLQGVLRGLEQTAAELRQNAAASIEMDPLPRAAAVYKAAKLAKRLSKLAERIIPQLAPLFKPRDGKRVK